MSQVISEMWRDASAAPLLAVLVILPAAFSFPSIHRGSLLAWVAPLILAGQVAADYWYHASAASDPGLGVAMEVTLVPWAIGATASVAAFVMVCLRSREAHDGPPLSRR